MNSFYVYSTPYPNKQKSVPYVLKFFSVTHFEDFIFKTDASWAGNFIMEQVFQFLKDHEIFKGFKYYFH